MSKRKIVALVITILLLGLILHKINWHELVITFKNFNFKNLWAIVVLYLLTMFIRGIRWKALLLNDSRYSSLNLGEIFIVGSMLNIFLPARAGDMYRAYYLGSVKNEKKMKVFGSIILERTLDGISVFFILLAAVLLYCKQDWILNIAYGIGALFIGSLLVFIFIFKFNKIDWICDKLVKILDKLPKKLAVFSESFVTKICAYSKSFMEGFEVLNYWQYCLIAVVSSFLIWGIEAYVAFLILESFNLGLGFAASLFVISLISFSTMIPSTSVFLGPYQYAYILALGIFGVQKSITLAISTVHQGILTLILTIFGLCYLLKFNISFNEIKNSASINEELSEIEQKNECSTSL